MNRESQYEGKKECKVDVISSKRKQFETEPTVITGSITAINSSQTDSYMDLEQDSDAFEDSSSDFLCDNNAQSDQDIDNIEF
ncbi:17422_t:CDS:2, partial [Racocetra fulgida]